MARKCRNKGKKNIHHGYMLGDLDLRHTTQVTTQKSSLPEWPFRLLDMPDELVLYMLRFMVVSSSLDDPIDIRPAVKSSSLYDLTATTPPEILPRFCEMIGPLRRAQKGDKEPIYRKAALPLMPPAITRANRMLREEGLKMFYGQNHFKTKSCDAGIECARIWLDLLHRADITTMSRLYVEWDMVAPLDSVNFKPRSAKRVEEFTAKDFYGEITFALDGDVLGLGIFPHLANNARLRFEGDRIVLWRRNSKKGKLLTFYRLALMPLCDDVRRWKSYTDVMYGDVIDRIPILDGETQNFWIDSTAVADSADAARVPVEGAGDARVLVFCPYKR